MGEDPSVIRSQIEETRERVGDEIDALSYKTDVGARVGDYVEEKKQAVKSRFTGAKEAVTGTTGGAISGAKDTVTGAKDTVTGAVPSRQAVRRSVTHVRGTAESNP